MWPAHGRRWSHLVSDTSTEELHAFAALAGIPRIAFEGDHYDVPDRHHAALVAAGAVPVPARELVMRLRASGLRMPKRRGETGLVRVHAVAFPDGTTADVDLIASPKLAQEHRVFAAMAFVRDAEGSLAVVHSTRRGEWGAPGGWREGEERVVDNAVREVEEETGLRLHPTALVPCGYERWSAVRGVGLWRPGQDLLQVFRADVRTVRPSLTATLDDTSDRRWVTPEEFAALCGHLFWWPLAERVLGRPAG
jgi:8-oxo-dGTP pyrophosphatase MutT (NUDIX family)